MKESKLASWIAYGGLTLAGLVLAGCANSGHDRRFTNLETGGQGAGAPGGSAPIASESNSMETGIADRIHVGDSLKITFADLPAGSQPPLPIEEKVREDGTITLLQNQTFEAKDKLRGQLEKEIRERYVPQYFKTMTVSIVQQNSSQFYYVLGEVRRPDRQVYLSRITVLKGIASAGDFTDFARKKAVELTRTDGRKFIINCIKAQKDPRLDMEVYPGDKIWVPRRNPFY